MEWQQAAYDEPYRPMRNADDGPRRFTTDVIEHIAGDCEQSENRSD